MRWRSSRRSQAPNCKIKEPGTEIEEEDRTIFGKSNRYREIKFAHSSMQYKKLFFHIGIFLFLTVQNSKCPTSPPPPPSAAAASSSSASTTTTTSTTTTLLTR